MVEVDQLEIYLEGNSVLRRLIVILIVRFGFFGRIFLRVMLIVMRSRLLLLRVIMQVCLLLVTSCCLC